MNGQTVKNFLKIANLNANGNTPFNILFAAGKIEGIESKTFRFFVDSIQTMDGVIDSFGSGIQKQQWTPTTAEAEVFLTSTSGSDTTQTVRVKYLNLQLEEQSVTVTLNGQTGVSVGTDFYRIRDFEVRTNKPNLGDIYLATSNASTSGIPDDLTTLQGILEANIGAYVDLLYTGRKGTIAVITSVVISVSGKTTGDLTTRTVLVSPDGSKTFGGAHIIPSGISTNQNLNFGLGLPAGVTAFTQIQTDTNNITYSQRTTLLEIETAVFDRWLDKQGITL